MLTILWPAHQDAEEDTGQPGATHSTSETFEERLSSGGVP